MHGVNYYHVYDKEKRTITDCIVAKDFASNRILKNIPEKLEKSKEWLIDQYDVSFGRLHIQPLVDEMARITNKPVSYYDEIVCQSFIKNITPKNKMKFLVDGRVVGSHRDLYRQLENYYIPRTKIWVGKPRFRPVNSSEYLM